MRVNVGASTLGNYIQNTREPDYETLKRLASYFNVSTDYLLDYRSAQAKSSQEDELLRLFRTFTTDEQDVLIEQGKLLIAFKLKKRKSSDSMISNGSTG